jgi:hypothetical protein
LGFGKERHASTCFRIVQDGKSITGKKNYMWTGNTGTKEHVINDSNAVAIMRITEKPEPMSKGRLGRRPQPSAG